MYCENNKADIFIFHHKIPSVFSTFVVKVLSYKVYSHVIVRITQGRAQGTHCSSLEHHPHCPGEDTKVQGGEQIAVLLSHRLTPELVLFPLGQWPQLTP